MTTTGHGQAGHRNNSEDTRAADSPARHDASECSPATDIIPGAGALPANDHVLDAGCENGCLSCQRGPQAVQRQRHNQPCAGAVRGFGAAASGSFAAMLKRAACRSWNQ
jgi:hypothetical protein